MSKSAFSGYSWKDETVLLPDTELQVVFAWGLVGHARLVGKASRAGKTKASVVIILGDVLRAIQTRSRLMKSLRLFLEVTTRRYLFKMWRGRGIPSAFQNRYNQSAFSCPTNLSAFDISHRSSYNGIRMMTGLQLKSEIATHLCRLYWVVSSLRPHVGLCLITAPWSITDSRKVLLRFAFGNRLFPRIQIVQWPLGYNLYPAP